MRLLLPFIDSFLLGAFRFRTRRFLRMQEAPMGLPAAPPEGVGCLYLHIPFCERLCPFCSFHRVQHHRPQAQRYFAALRAEVRRYHEMGFRFSGAYFGGGTPTCEPGELLETVSLVQRLFGARDISVETNPRDLDREFLLALRGAGVTRLSVGVQSFDDQLLREMDRYETYGSGAEAFERLRGAAGIFPTLNVDLMFNLPHQEMGSLERDLERLHASGANQASFYPLMTSPAIARQLARSVGLPGRRRLRPFYERILSGVAREFVPSSAWCFSRREGASDEYIVEADYYIGVGSGAFSYAEGALYATSFSLDVYEKRIAEGLTGITVQSRLSETNQMRYSLLVKLFGLRLDRDWVLRRYGERFFHRLWGELRSLEWLGAAGRDNRGWTLTPRGMYWLVLMMSAFFESVARYRDALRAHIPAERVARARVPSAATPLPIGRSVDLG